MRMRKYSVLIAIPYQSRYEGWEWGGGGGGGGGAGDWGWEGDRMSRGGGEGGVRGGRVRQGSQGKQGAGLLYTAHSTYFGPCPEAPGLFRAWSSETG